MILKQLRISRHLSQEQLARMSGLNVRTIQRIESGHNASVESLKCLASVLEVEISHLNQERFMLDKSPDGGKSLPLWLRAWFAFNFFSFRATKPVARRVELMSHASGFLFCLMGFVSEAALAGGVLMLANAYLFAWLSCAGDKYGVWYEAATR